MALCGSIKCFSKDCLLTWTGQYSAQKISRIGQKNAEMQTNMLMNLHRQHQKSVSVKKGSSFHKGHWHKRQDNKLEHPFHTHYKNQPTAKRCSILLQLKPSGDRGRRITSSQKFRSSMRVLSLSFFLLVLNSQRSICASPSDESKACATTFFFPS